jgi:hypothetical protein
MQPMTSMFPLGTDATKPKAGIMCPPYEIARYDSNCGNGVLAAIMQRFDGYTAHAGAHA